jgi:hypothetical protein
MLPPPAQPHVQTDYPQFEYLPPSPESEYRQPMPEPEEKKAVNQSPAKQRAGQTSVSRFIKAILRPFFKGMYYTIRWIRGHKLVSIIAALLLIGSILATSYFVAGTLPFSSSSDSVTTSIKNNPQLSPDIQNWLIALRNGDLNTMITIQKSMNPATRPPDSALYVMQFSEKYGGTKWTNASLISIKTAPDGLVDSFIEIDMTQPATTGTAQVISLWHFTTTQGGNIFLIDYVSSRSR